MASCAVAGQPQQEEPQPEHQQPQAQQQVQQEQSASASHSVQSVAARVAMFNALGSGNADKSNHGTQQPLTRESRQPSSVKQQEVSSRQWHQQRLLVLLTRCAEMEQLLAHLLPGFLALNADDIQQVSGSF